MRNTSRALLATVAVFAVASAATAQFPDRARPGPPPFNRFGLDPRSPVGMPRIPGVPVDMAQNPQPAPFPGVNGGLVPMPLPGFPLVRPGIPAPGQQREQDRTDHSHYLHLGHAFIPHGERPVPVVPPANFSVPEASFNPAATRGFGRAAEFTTPSRPVLPAVKSLSWGGKGILGGIGAGVAAFFAALFGRGKNPADGKGSRAEGTSQTARRHPQGFSVPPNTGPSMSPPPVQPLEDLLIRPDEVVEKVRQTTRLLAALAKREAAFDPRALHEFVAATFTRVQRCWEARDYGPVRGLLGPPLLERHEELLRAMTRDREINRIEDLRVRWLEFVHVSCPAEADRQEVTALITFVARVYFVDDRDGAFLRGSHKVIPCQEFWVFSRYGDSWRLVDIDRSDESNRLESANQVDDMTDAERRNAEAGVIAL